VFQLALNKPLVLRCIRANQALTQNGAASHCHLRPLLLHSPPLCVLRAVLIDETQDNPGVYESTSQVKRAGDLSGRVMLIFGTYDDNVHPQNEYALMNELVEKGKPFEVMVYPLRKHGIGDTPARIHLAKTMQRFWKQNL
jgi:hypothetical protein